MCEEELKKFKWKYDLRGLINKFIKT
jgi:hypothetical protein